MANTVTISGTIRGRDDESWPDDDEYADTTFNEVVDIDEDNPQAAIPRQELKFGGEICIHFDADVSLLSSGRINAKCKLYLYEGDAENCSDEDDTHERSWIVRANKVRNALLETHTGGGDWATCNFTIVNHHESDE